MLFTVTRVSQWDRMHASGPKDEPQPCEGAVFDGCGDGWSIEVPDLAALVALQKLIGHDVVLGQGYDPPELWIVDTEGGAVPNDETRFAEARARIKRAAAIARKDAEYMNGYNSGGWVSGRKEGLEIADSAIAGTLKVGQWCEPLPFNPDEPGAERYPAL